VLRLGVGVRSVIFRPHLCVLCAIHTILCCLLVRLLASRCTMYTLYPMFTTARGVPRTVRAAVAGPVFCEGARRDPLRGVGVRPPTGGVNGTLHATVLQRQLPRHCPMGRGQWGTSIAASMLLTLCRWRLDIIGHSECRRRRCSNGNADGMRLCMKRALGFIHIFNTL